jgi:hypothetical protein
MQEDIQHLEGRLDLGSGILQTKENPGQEQVAAGGNGKELAEPLNQTEKSALEYIHTLTSFKLQHIILPQDGKFGKLDGDRTLLYNELPMLSVFLLQKTEGVPENEAWCCRAAQCREKHAV